MSLSFYAQLGCETAIEKAHFHAIPLILRAVASGVDRDLYLKFLASAYHHVRQTCPLLGLALSRCGEEDAPLRAGLLAYLDEEKGHEAWILDDIRALGGDAEAVRTTLPAFPVRMMVAYATYAIEHVSPYAMLGMVHVLEGLSVTLARAAACAIIAGLDRDPGQGGFHYLTSHGHLDESHVALFAQLLDQIDSPERRTIIIQAAKDFYQLYGDIFRALDQTMEIRHAA